MWSDMVYKIFSFLVILMLVPNVMSREAIRGKDYRYFLAAGKDDPPPCDVKPGQTFCEEVENYPYEAIFSALKKKRFNIVQSFQSETGGKPDFGDVESSAILNVNRRNVNRFSRQTFNNDQGKKPQEQTQNIFQIKPENIDRIGENSPKSRVRSKNDFVKEFQYVTASSATDEYNIGNSKDEYSEDIQQVGTNNRKLDAPTSDFNSVPTNSQDNHLLEEEPYTFVTDNQFFYYPHTSKEETRLPEDINSYDRRRRSLNYTVGSSNSHHRAKRRLFNKNLEIDSSVCPAISRMTYPKTAMCARTGDWMYIVNVHEFFSEYSQMIRVEICRPEVAAKPCRGHCEENVILGAVNLCHQHYIQKRLFTLSSTGSEIVQDVFWIPTCCYCATFRKPGV